MSPKIKSLAIPELHDPYNPLFKSAGLKSIRTLERQFSWTDGYMGLGGMPDFSMEQDLLFPIRSSLSLFGHYGSDSLTGQIAALKAPASALPGVGLSMRRFQAEYGSATSALLKSYESSGILGQFGHRDYGLSGFWEKSSLLELQPFRESFSAPDYMGFVLRARKSALSTVLASCEGAALGIKMPPVDLGLSKHLELIEQTRSILSVADGLGPRWEGRARDWENKLLTQTLTGEDVEGVINLSQQTIEAVAEAASGGHGLSRRLTIMQAALLLFVLNAIINHYTPLLTEKGISQEAVATFKELLPVILMHYTDQSASSQTVPPGR